MCKTLTSLHALRLIKKFQTVSSSVYQTTPPSFVKTFSQILLVPNFSGTKLHLPMHSSDEDKIEVLEISAITIQQFVRE